MDECSSYAKPSLPPIQTQAQAQGPNGLKRALMKSKFGPWMLPKIGGRSRLADNQVIEGFWQCSTMAMNRWMP